jgi:hypothetical protein
VLFELAFEGSGCACPLAASADGGKRLAQFAQPLLQRGARLQLLLCDAQEGPGKFDSASAVGFSLARLQAAGLGALASGRVGEVVG